MKEYSVIGKHSPDVKPALTNNVSKDVLIRTRSGLTIIGFYVFSNDPCWVNAEDTEESWYDEDIFCWWDLPS